MQVTDLDASAKAVLKNGGQVALEKFAIPGTCWEGYFLDPEGNTFGLFHLDEQAKWNPRISADPRHDKTQTSTQVTGKPTNQDLGNHTNYLMENTADVTSFAPLGGAWQSRLGSDPFQ